MHSGDCPMSRAPSAWNEVTAGGVRWWIVPSCREHLLGPQGLRLDEWLEAGQAQLVKKGPHRLVYRVELPGLAFYVKHNRVPDLQTWFRQLIRPSKARIELSRIETVAERGVAT